MSDKKKPSYTDLQCRLRNANNLYDRLVASSNAQIITINNLRDALLHLANRDHEHSDDCGGCANLQSELKAARHRLTQYKTKSAAPKE